MTRNEVKTLLLKICAIYPSWKMPDLTLTIDAWLMVLENEDAAAVNEALKIYSRTNKSGFAPSPGALTTIVSDRAETRLTDGEIMAMLTAAARNGSYGYEREYNSLPGLLQKAVGSPAMIRFWGSQEPEALTYTFGRVCAAYRALEFERRQDRAVTSDKVKRLTEATLTKMGAEAG